MAYAFYIAAVLGAIGVYLTLPHPRNNGKAGGLVALAGLVGLFVFLALALPWPVSPASIYYWLFSAISLAAAVRVITHPRPVYSALYFVLVVLATSGMLIMLSAEFMAFALVIIYGGAILVTYMFVIMLATMPQSANQPETSPEYDRTARSPALSVVMGFALVAALSTVIFAPPPAPGVEGNGADGAAATNVIPRVSPDYAWARLLNAAAVMPGKFDVEDRSRAKQLNTAMRDHELIAADEYVGGVVIGENAVTAEVFTGDPYYGRSRARLVELPRPVVEEFVANIDMVGLNLFESHTLGIELAAVILLLSMVGAIVIARRQAPESEGASVPRTDDPPVRPRNEERVLPRA